MTKDKIVQKLDNIRVSSMAWKKHAENIRIYDAHTQRQQLDIIAEMASAITTISWALSRQIDPHS